MFLSALVCVVHYSATKQAMVLMAGAAIRQGVVFLKGRKVEIGNNSRAFVVYVLVVLLAYASLWPEGTVPTFQYRNHTRWSGPWNDPDMFGLLMGTGVVLAGGLFLQILNTKLYRYESRVRGNGAIILWIVAAGFMTRGLQHSYSRGALVATLCGAISITVHWLWNFRILCARTQNACVSYVERNGCALFTAIMFSTVIIFWHVRQTKWHPAQRVFSVVNANDFSWRNRIYAWEGALQMVAEHPWFGEGWNQPTQEYEHYYLRAGLTESGAIQRNDYLMLGAMIGLPALFCFGMYSWSSMAQKSICPASVGRGWLPKLNEGYPSNQGISDEDETPDSLLQIRDTIALLNTCRAGAIVLTVGFWFDGGLFDLATASTFWILLELGRSDVHRGDPEKTIPPPSPGQRSRAAVQASVLTIDTTSSARSRFLILHRSNPHFSGGCEEWFIIRVLQSQRPARRTSESLLRRAFGPTLFQATGLCTAPTLSLPIPYQHRHYTPSARASQ